MSELIVVGFPDEHQAQEVQSKLLRMQREHLVELEDAAVVIHRADGKVRLRQTQNLPMAGAVSGGFWGMFLGLLFAAPFAGAALGAGAGALVGAAADIGVDDQFMKDLGRTLPAGTSALFVLVKKATPDKVIEHLQPFGGTILRTSLSHDAEAHLREMVERTQRGDASHRTAV